MKTDILVDAIGMINDDIIRDAKSSHKRPVTVPLRKVIALASAIVLCVISSVPALSAADVEPAYRLLYAISPPIAQELKPVRESCTDNGIRMEVISAYVHGDTAEIFISMQDLEENRIDATSDLFDSYEIRNSYDNYAHCSFVNYDKETGTATFLITVKQMDGENFRGDKITFSTSRLLSNKSITEGTISEIDLASINKNPVTQSIYDHDNLQNWQGRTEFLQPESNFLAVPTEGVSVTAVGYIDGEVHVQVYYEDIFETDNHGWLYLKDTDGNLTLFDTKGPTFWDASRSGSYQEYILAVPYDELGNYELYGEFTTCRQLTKGNWQITFSLKDVQ